jgi:hypothetical protein
MQAYWAPAGSWHFAVFFVADDGVHEESVLGIREGGTLLLVFSMHAIQQQQQQQRQ